MIRYFALFVELNVCIFMAGPLRNIHAPVMYNAMKRFTFRKVFRKQHFIAYRISSDITAGLGKR